MIAKPLVSWLSKEDIAKGSATFWILVTSRMTCWVCGGSGSEVAVTFNKFCPRGACSVAVTVTQSWLPVLLALPVQGSVLVEQNVADIPLGPDTLHVTGLLNLLIGLVVRLKVAFPAKVGAYEGNAVTVKSALLGNWP